MTTSTIQKMQSAFRSFSPFSELSIIGLLAGGLILAFFSKTESHLFINQCHAIPFDYLFTFITILGDGSIAALIVLVLLFIRFRFALMMAVSNIACSLTVQSFKRLIFTHSVRPLEYFKGVHQLYLVPGVDVYSFNSFPSGHSATVFTTCALLCVMVKRKSLSIFFFLLACLVAFSRVYLSQHFLEDIYAGSIIGVLAAWITEMLLGTKNENREGIDASLCTLLIKNRPTDGY